MTIRTVQSPNPGLCIIRTMPDDDREAYLETTYGPMELARLIAELSGELNRMHQSEHLRRSGNVYTRARGK